jgi:hypothetical protein
MVPFTLFKVGCILRVGVGSGCTCVAVGFTARVVSAGAFVVLAVLVTSLKQTAIEITRKKTLLDIFGCWIMSTRSLLVVFWVLKAREHKFSAIYTICLGVHTLRINNSTESVPVIGMFHCLFIVLSRNPTVLMSPVTCFDIQCVSKKVNPFKFKLLAITYCSNLTARIALN